jgi:hypothetical protein
LFVAGSPVIAGLDDKVHWSLPLGPVIVAVKFTTPPTPLTLGTLGVKLVTFVITGAAPATAPPTVPSTATAEQNKSVAASRKGRTRGRTASPYLSSQQI